MPNNKKVIKRKVTKEKSLAAKLREQIVELEKRVSVEREQKEYYKGKYEVLEEQDEKEEKNRNDFRNMTVQQEEKQYRVHVEERDFLRRLVLLLTVDSSKAEEIAKLQAEFEMGRRNY